MRQAECIVLIGLLVPACGGATLVALEPRVETANVARIEVAAVEGEVITFDVYDLSKLGLVVLRDKIVLETPAGRRGREQGGIARYYNVPPGGMHDVKVKFALDDCTPGQEVKVLFDGALLADGAVVPVAPVRFSCARH
jgi:hypothetical protein